MKRLLLTVLAALAGTCAVYAQSLRSIDIRAVLNPDGSARITQVYDATVVDGTEMYIPITNLGEMTVGDLTVRENGLAYHNEGRRWDTDRSLSEKAGRCGIIEKRNGVELCWGKTSYGDHVWTIEYTVTGLVQSFTDADGFNFMFVNPGFDAPAQHVKVTLVNGTGGPQWTYDNTRVWGFGSYGDINVMDDGTIVYESSEPFSYESKVIELVRFEKGLFQPEIERDMSFDELKENALDGSSYGEDDKAETFFKWLMAILVGGSLLASLRAAVLQALGYKYKKSMYGKTKITEWFREAPMGGNLFASSYVLDNGWRFAGPASSKNLIGALFLRWILDGKVKAMPDPDKPKRVNLAFTPGLTFDDDVEGALYNMAVEASGGNLLLESGEFEKWSEKHCTTSSSSPGPTGRRPAAGASSTRRISCSTAPPPTRTARNRPAAWWNSRTSSTTSPCPRSAAPGKWACGRTTSCSPSCTASPTRWPSSSRSSIRRSSRNFPGPWAWTRPRCSARSA